MAILTKPRVIGLAILALTLIVIASIWVYCHQLFSGHSKQSIEELLLKSSLKKGSSEDEVRSWLTQNGFKTGSAVKPPQALHNFEADSVNKIPEASGIKPEDVAELRTVIIYGRHLSIASQEIIIVDFYFNKQKRLLGYVVIGSGVSL